MPRLLGLAFLLVATTASAEPNNQIRADLAVGGPGGMMALRYSRVLPTGTRIEPAFGLAYTGLIGSVLVTQPFTTREWSTPSGTKYSTKFEVYGGYGMSALRDGLHHPWAGDADRVPNGNYHWADFGLSMQTKWRSLLITAGSGASILVSSPKFEEMEDDDDWLWFFFPEGWMREQRWVPTLWSSIGWEF
jgi:hypothetical protein